jgi:trimethylamine--corrinoid protein Co-methyltransferase
VLTGDQIQSVHQASLNVLSTIGLRIFDPSILDLLATFGAEVDYPKKIARIPAELVEDEVSKVPRSPTLYGRASRWNMPLQTGSLFSHPSGGMTRVMDGETLNVREANLSDLERLVCLVDSLENLHCCTTIVSPSDVPSQCRDVHAAECVFRNTEKHAIVAPSTAKQLHYIAEICKHLAGGVEELRKKHILTCVISPTSPLAYSTEATQMLRICAENGLPVSLLPTPLAGATSPVTLAGTLVQQNAEILGGNVVVQLLAPKTIVTYSPRPMALDMRTGVPVYGGVEYGIMSACAVQLARRYGFPTDVAGFGTNSKVLDEQSAFERTINALAAAQAGANVLDGAGLLEHDLTASAEQLVIDNEILGLIKRTLSGINLDKENLAVDVIRRVGHEGNFLAERHTLDHFRSEHYVPTLCDRRTRIQWERMGARDIVKAAREKMHNLLEHHTPPTLDHDTLLQIRALVRQSEQ